MVCKLRRPLYSLKQSPRVWFERFTRLVRGHSYTQSHSDSTMFYKHSDKRDITILIVYVDDIIITSNDVSELKKLKYILAKEFKIKDLS